VSGDNTSGVAPLRALYAANEDATEKARQCDGAMSHANIRYTERLRLEPIDVCHANDLLALSQDPAVAQWPGNWTRGQVELEMARIARRWRVDGVHKWMAYHRLTGESIGRGGLSRKHVDGHKRLEVGCAVYRRFWAGWR
jgi:ribosomal-protein-alanine N-acetyltransferase